MKIFLIIIFMVSATFAGAQFVSCSTLPNLFSSDWKEFIESGCVIGSADPRPSILPPPDLGNTIPRPLSEKLTNEDDMRLATEENWKMYQNRTYGFEIRYPAIWQVVLHDEKKEDGVLGWYIASVEFAPKEAIPGKSIRIFIGSMQISTIKEKIKQFWFPNKTQEEVLTIKNNTGGTVLKEISNENNLATGIETYLFENSDFVFTITTHNETPHMVFKRMLSTFQFLDK